MGTNEEVTYPELHSILEDTDIPDKEKSAKIKQMYLDELALQRAGSESSMEAEHHHAPRLQQLAKALDTFGVDISSIKDNPATL